MSIITLDERVVHNNVDCGQCGGDNFAGTSDVRCSFEIVPASPK